MKKIFFLTACSLVAIAFHFPATAQSPVRFTSMNRTSSSPTSYELNADNLLKEGKAVTTMAIKSRVLRTFNQSFKDIAPEWFVLDDTFLAKLTVAGLPAHALFAKNGYMLYSVNHGTEQSLPPEVRRMIRSTYYDHSITGVTKVDAQERTAWIINLQSADQLLVVKVIGRELEEIGNYQSGITVPK